MADASSQQALAAAPVPGPRIPNNSDDGSGPASPQAAGTTPGAPIAQSSSKRQAHFSSQLDDADDDGEDFPRPFPQLREGSSSLVQAVSQLRMTFSESVLDVAPPQMFCYVLAACACLNSCNLGYDVGSVGGASLLMKDHFGWSSWELGFYVGSINFFCVPGALYAGYLCDRIGRRLTFTLSCLVFIVGLLIQVVATGGAHSFAIAMFGRAFVGIGVGLGLSIDPLYISEVSPPSHRGHLVSFSEIAINFGIVLGFIADYAFLGLPTGTDWRLMLGLGIVMPIILIVLTLTVMPESPRWLLMKGRHDEAIAVLRRTYPRTTNFERLAEEITSTIEADFEADHGSTWHAILRPSPVVARMLLAGVGLAACQQLNGSESLVYFSPEILRRAGFVSRSASFGMTILIGLSKMLFTLVAVFYVDQAGRRPLLLLSTGGLCICLILMAAVSPFEKLNGVMVFAMCLYMALFSIGIGPLTWVGATEVFSTRIRAKAMSLSVSTNRLISAFIASATIPLLHALTSSGYFILYGVLCFVSMIYIYMYFPETKGRTLEEVEHHFEAIVARSERKRQAQEAAAAAATVESGKATEQAEEAQVSEGMAH